MKTKYGIKEYLEEYRQALEQKPETPQGQPKGKPNLIELQRAAKQLRGTGRELPLT